MVEVLDKNLGKLEKLLSLMDEDSLTKTDFLKAFENVVSFVVKIQTCVLIIICLYTVKIIRKINTKLSEITSQSEALK